MDPFDLLLQQARYYRADTEGRGGGRVADAYGDAAAQGGLLSLPTGGVSQRPASPFPDWYYNLGGLLPVPPASVDASREVSPSIFQNYLLDVMKKNRTGNPFYPGEAQLSAAYPASGISSEHRIRYPQGVQTPSPVYGLLGGGV